MSSKLEDPSEMTTNKNIEDFKPREYQVELFERVMKHNTIIFLPTGSGKTFIAVMVIKHKSNDLKLLYSEGGKRTFFLVNTVALVAQQAQSIRQQTPLTVGEYSAEKGVDHWDINQWHEELENHQVLVMTAAIFHQMILHDYITLPRVNLLVIDECHHAVNKHPMKLVMEEFKGVPTKDRPHVLGLTATLLNSNCKPERIPTEIHNLEITMHAKIARAENEEMIQAFSTNPKEEVVIYNIEEDDECFAVVKSSIDEIYPILKLIVLVDSSPKPPSSPPNATLVDNKSDTIIEITNILKEIVLITRELGGYASTYVLLLRIVHFERMRISASDQALVKLLGHIIIQLHLIRKKLELIMKNRPGKIFHYSTSKMIELFKLLQNFEEKSLALVFVERKTTAKVLYYVLDDLAASIEEYKYIKPDFIVGVNSNPYHITREYILERKKNHKILKKFNMGEINILVASDVIEEGIDVKNCNFVIKFDHPKTARSYIQSKGRARHRDSKYIVFAPSSNSNAFHRNYITFKQSEETLKQELCYGRDQSRRGGTEAEAELFLYSKEVEPFFIDGPIGPKVTVESAISLLNRYCFTLPCDKFTRLTVFFWKKEVIVDNKPKTLCFLQLPINCPLKGIIEGQPCENLVTAKGAVALNACKMLYKIGELNEHLLPVGNEVQNVEEKILCPLWEDEKDQKSLHKPGTKKSRRIYDKQFPRWICGGFPQVGQPVYIHVLKILPNYPKPENDRLLAFYNLLLSNKNFAVLSSKKWPKLCNFPLFMNVGEVRVNIQQNARKITLNQEQYKKILAFHSLLFTEAWSLKKEFLVREYENKENSYYVVPAIVDNDSITIDWETIKNHGEIPPVKAVPLDSRGDIIVTKDKYLNKIVIPWYRPKGFMLKYVVTRVCEEQTPMSPFPSEQYSSYSDYFFKRYNQSVVNKNQKLIEVRAISGKNNCLLPRGKYRLGKKRRRDEEDFEETLVPELCTLLEFPAVYMLKITLLPSILHRINILLNAEELRQKIAAETGLGVVKLPSGVYWSSLEVDDTALAGDESSNARSTIEVSNMLADKMVELQPKDCTWDKEEEPIDIERNLRNLDLLSVLHYEKFAKIEISADQIDRSNGMVSERGSSVKKSNIMRPPKVNAPEIPILSDKNCVLGPELGSILKALTASSSNDVMNYERLETLGDSFLKFLVSLILFVHFENKDEGKLSSIKGKIIGNRNLYYSGKYLSLGKILKVNDFIPDDWEVPGFTILESIKKVIINAKIPPSVLYQISLTKKERDTAVLNEETRSKIHELFCNSSPADESTHSSLGVIGQQCVVDKVIADAVEALIGVYLEACGIEGAFKLCKWLKILPENMCDIDKVLYEPAPSAQILDSGDVNDVLVMPEVIESILGYRFRNRSYLLQALTHCSFRQNFTDCYQRLEFLGDAILDFLITSHIYNKCKNISPGELTDLRSALVNNVTFACLTVRYGFHKFMLTKTCKLTDIIKRFVEHQEKRNHKIGAEILFLLSENDVEAAEIVDVPKVLGDLFESLAAAVYLDSGKSLNTVWKIFYKLMHNEIEEFMRNIPKNSIRLLYEKFPIPAPCFEKPRFLNENQTIVMVPLIVTAKNDRMRFIGVGENKNQAKLAAAKVALRHYYLDPM
ncbi:endoribonuclease Dicer [Halyomorpha halys]|uniref:endoribonuclease Dicer n=1 Tax=Halyomorpha halys TaxID=286706 RepID=UPI0006D4FA21|nr:endoribonuclease Dicer isoform X2 [Halyomorpha halys]